MRGVEAAGLVVIAILLGAGGGYLAGDMNAHTVTSILSTTYVVTETHTLSTSTGATYFEAPFIYLTNDGLCTSGSSYVPCWGNPAYLLNSCPNLLAGPSTPFTCNYEMTASVSPYPTVSFNITLGVFGGSGEPGWASCSVGSAGSNTYADCVPVINSTAFIVGIQSGPPL